MDIKEILLKTTLFTGLSHEDIERLVGAVKLLTIPANELFIKKGESADALYIIKSGVCQIYTHDEDGCEIILARITTGDYFGEQALLNEVPGKRNANVRTVSEVELLKIDHKIFNEILAHDINLKEFLFNIGRQQMTNRLVQESLNKIYKSRVRGEIRQYQGKFLDLPAIINNFCLSSGREISATRVLDKSIRTITDVNVAADSEVEYRDDNNHRVLLLKDHILIGVTSYGEWEDLPNIITMIFNQTPLDKKQLEYFSLHGELVVVLPEEDESLTLSSDRIICNCMYISLGDIKAHINSGVTELQQMSEITGAGTVCGTCVPAIQEILGHGGWRAVRIKKVLPLTSNIHAYHLIPALGESLPTFQAGQYVVLQCSVNGNWINRSYTLTSSASDNEFYEIAIKRVDNGILSNWLFDNEGEIPLLRISAPDGKFILNFDLSKPAVCLMAGIGITPGVSFARTSSARKSQRPIIIYYSAHTEHDFSYLQELKQIAEVHPYVTLCLRSTKNEGRLQMRDIAEICKKYPDADYYICGPATFETSMRAWLNDSGITDEQVYIEKFTYSHEPA